MKRAGIYRIQHIATGNQYIGSSVNVDRRLSDHRGYLRRGKHHSIYLQRAWNKYGEDSFIFEFLWAVDPEKDALIFEEQMAFNHIRCDFNMLKVAGSNLGKKTSEETKLKLSIAGRGRIVSSEARAKLSASRKKISAQIIAKLLGNTFCRGKTRSPEAVAKTVAANTGKKRSAEIRAGISKRNTGRPVSAETREKMSKANTGKKCSEETKAKMSKASKGKPKSEEAKERMSLAAKLRWAKSKEKSPDENSGTTVPSQD
jgi:group I intron endonuclease